MNFLSLNIMLDVEKYNKLVSILTTEGKHRHQFVYCDCCVCASCKPTILRSMNKELNISGVMVVHIHDEKEIARIESYHCHDKAKFTFCSFLITLEQFKKIQALDLYDPNWYLAKISKFTNHALNEHLTHKTQTDDEVLDIAILTWFGTCSLCEDEYSRVGAIFSTYEEMVDHFTQRHSH